MSTDSDAETETEAEEPVMDRTGPSDEQQTERESYLWLGAILVVGVGLLFAFPDMRLELGAVVLVALAFVWGYKTFVEAAE